MPHACRKITPAFYQWPTLACSGWHVLSPFISWAHPWSHACCEHSGLWDSRLNCPTLDTDGFIKHRGQVSCSAATFGRSFNCLLTLGSGLSFHRATKPGGSEGRQAPLWKHWVIRSQLSFLNHRTGKMHTHPPTSSSVHTATLQLWLILTNSRQRIYLTSPLLEPFEGKLRCSAHGNLTRVLIGDSSPSMADSFGSAGLGYPQLCKCIIPVHK